MREIRPRVEMNNGKRGILENIPLPAQTMRACTSAASSGVQLAQKETGPSAAAWEWSVRAGEDAGFDFMPEYCGILNGGKVSVETVKAAGGESSGAHVCVWSLYQFVQLSKIISLLASDYPLIQLQQYNRDVWTKFY